MAVVVALAVTAAPQSRFGKDLFVKLALFTQLDLGLKLIDFSGKLGVQLIRQFLFPGRCHRAFSLSQDKQRLFRVWRKLSTGGPLRRLQRGRYLLLK
jgi:hypothetical protein